MSPFLRAEPCVILRMLGLDAVLCVLKEASYCVCFVYGPNVVWCSRSLCQSLPDLLTLDLRVSNSPPGSVSFHFLTLLALPLPGSVFPRKVSASLSQAFVQTACDGGFGFPGVSTAAPGPLGYSIAVSSLSARVPWEIRAICRKP